MSADFAATRDMPTGRESVGTPSAHRDALMMELDHLFIEPRAWLETPNSNLGGRTPSDLLREGNSEAVLNLLLLMRHVGSS